MNKIVNSHYVGRSTGDKVTIRTICDDRGETYLIFNGGWRVAEYRTRASVRRYIMNNDLRPVS